MVHLVFLLTILIAFAPPLARAQTTYKVVIDPQYGGKEFGPTGSSGVRAKDISLAIAKELGNKLTAKSGIAVIYTRKSDNYVTLQERVLAANKSSGDVLISIGLNGASNTSARGLEIFKPDLISVKVLEAKDGGEKNSESRAFIKDLVSTEEEKNEKSKELAAVVHTELIRQTGLRDRGIRSSLFYVIVGPKMPSVMIMVGFLTNMQDEELLKDPSFQEQIAHAIFNGVVKFLATTRKHQKRQEK